MRISDWSSDVCSSDLAEAQWAGETEARSETTTARVGMQTIPVWEIYAKPKATQKFLEDSGVDVAAWLARKCGERFGRREATGFVAGTGIKQPRGFVTYRKSDGEGKRVSVRGDLGGGR